MYLAARYAAIAALMMSATTSANAQSSSRARYLDLARQAFERSVHSLPLEIDRWNNTYQPSPIWGYGPPAGPVWHAGLAGALYALTEDEQYATEAAGWMAQQQRFREAYPDSMRAARPDYARGLPVLSDFFHLPVYCRAYQRIKTSPSVSREQLRQIEENIASSADYQLFHPEWGPMNRAMLRAEGLLAAAQALPDHPEAPRWRKLAGILARDSWGRWAEEDAQIYHPVWVRALLHYADALGDPSLFGLLPFRYYFDYFLHLLSPAAMVPEFGDARWNENWAEYLACLERGATLYGDPALKWGATRIAGAMLPRVGATLNARTALTLLDAYRWADEEIPPMVPTTGSEEVLEDVIGKKIVFRDGWGDRDTYMLLNYRDEGPFAHTAREYLRLTIPVEEEKMHHGHSDENAICLLMSGGSVLLHNPGYRDAIPSGPYGAFRADYFHNTFVGRTGKRGRRQPLFEFLRSSGGYRPVETEKIDFFNWRACDASRTRVHDPRRGYASDRVIVYLKRENLFVVFDIVKILKTGFYTFATLWHATSVEDRGAGTYVTAVDSIRAYHPPADEALLIHFPQGGIRHHGTFGITRAHQPERAVYQTISSHYYAGQIETVTTILIPHPRGADLSSVVESIEMLPVAPTRAGVGLRVKTGQTIHLICVKTDLDRDVLADNVRPRYTFDSGRVAYGPVETDASLFYGRLQGHQLDYSAANMVKIIYGREEIFASRVTTFTLQPDDLSTGYGATKWRYWEDRVHVSR